MQVEIATSRQYTTVCAMLFCCRTRGGVAALGLGCSSTPVRDDTSHRTRRLRCDHGLGAGRAGWIVQSTRRSSALWRLDAVATASTTPSSAAGATGILRHRHPRQQHQGRRGRQDFPHDKISQCRRGYPPVMSNETERVTKCSRVPLHFFHARSQSRHSRKGPDHAAQLGKTDDWKRAGRFNPASSHPQRDSHARRQRGRR